ncbi:MAG: cytochrome c oxidase accessory protein CcoG [Planctomycetota bacterium]
MSETLERPSPGGGGSPDSRKPSPARGGSRRPDLDSLFSINPDGSRNAIHPADVKGRFQRRKNALWGVLIAVYLAMPWVKIGGKPAILIDIGARHFYLFGRTFNAQDFWLAFFYLSGLGFALFVVAALFGRLWCGYACPQTVFLEGVFRRIERWIEGKARERMKLDREPLRGRKLGLRALKLSVYLVISLVLSHSFLGYFMPVERVLEAVTSRPTAHPTAFLFTAVFTAIIFVNFAWFREQLCIVVCPYGRLQGALYDPDTIVVGYDRRRGEPRGRATESGRGDCVDCDRCVAVCPTGIDIRNGTQLECVGCANCIDACDEVMDRLGRPRGLVRYDSQNGFDGDRRKFLRPRVALYSVLLCVGLLVFLFAASKRVPFEANLVRAPGMAFTIDAGLVRNSFTLHLLNKLPEARDFRIEGLGPEGAEIVIAQPEIRLESLSDAQIVVLVQQGRKSFQRGRQLEVRVTTTGDEGRPLERIARAPFAGPVR